MVSKLRPRTRHVKPESYATAVEDTTDLHIHISSRRPTRYVSRYSPTTSPESTPPVYTINLSLPPEERYKYVALDFEDQLNSLKQIFDEVISVLRVPSWLLHFIAWLFLRCLYSTEQTREIKGISQTIHTPLYLLIAYNVFLDLFMGCTSGGVLARASEDEEPSMLHFRTLDWGMPQLREVIVQYDFIEESGGEVIASTLSYVGFVGVLTGVTKDLSVSLNFRPYHNNDVKLWENTRFRFHQLMVLLGFRPSISSVLRDFLIPRHENGRTIKKESEHRAASSPHFGRPDICIALPGIATTAAYLTFCTGVETIVLEKDLYTAKILRSTSFITTTNHDACYDRQPYAPPPTSTPTLLAILSKPHDADLVGMEGIVEESVDRKKCLVERWNQFQRRQKMSRRGTETSNEDGIKGVVACELKWWLLEYPVTNEDTHFVCIMNPKKGNFQWVKKFGEWEIES